jgi:beta-hydroxylase
LQIFIRQFIRQFKKVIPYFSLVGDTPFLDTQKFGWIPDLESNWMKIRQELDQLLHNIDDIPNYQEISPAQYQLTQDNLWKTYLFYGFGIKEKKNCERCPATADLIKKIPGMKTAFFSVMLPHKHVPQHRGVYKGLLRYHLGLIVPQPKNSCRIRVDSNIAYWEKGKGFIFDDTYEHEVWNDSNAVRVVLIIDVVRPMYFPFSMINHFLIQLISRTPLIQEAEKRQKEWNKHLEKLERET